MTSFRSLRPYLTIVNTWLTEGRLEDWRGEFLFYTREDGERRMGEEQGVQGEEGEEQKGEGEGFWDSFFLARDYRARLKAEVVFSIIYCCAVQCSAVQYCAALRSAVQCSFSAASVCRESLPYDSWTAWMPRFWPVGRVSRCCTGRRPHVHVVH